MPPLSAITTAAFSPRSNSRSPRPTPNSTPNAAPGPGSRGANRPATPDAPAVPAQSVAQEPVAQEEASVTDSTAAKKAAEAAPKKLRRSRVPGNLAQMYGESTGKRAPQAAPAAEEPRKTRRDAQAREKRRALMQVDDTVLQRLSQSAATALVVGEESETPARRGRTWQVACGKCGTRSTFRTAGALCPVCNAICLREVAS